ncbi:uncharacterized protein LOC131617743 [Vicia villosa]|uniref:uncharacterized protein LOC131617743 n=1 Tax=Vicia villosa TaxID=3911 RepID=UPI00273ABF09|nr:uncharacterized protein LOC131617743 [Vicia villosa]
MGRQDNDPNSNSTMVKNSSIALLQERFRQLEKVKERREGKQLLRLLSSSETNTNTQQRFIVSHNNRSSYDHDSLSLGLNLTNKQGDKNNMKSNTSLSEWSQGASSSLSRNFDASDVDTSLHL